MPPAAGSASISTLCGPVMKLCNSTHGVADRLASVVCAAAVPAPITRPTFSWIPKTFVLRLDLVSVEVPAFAATAKRRDFNDLSRQRVGPELRPA